MDFVTRLAIDLERELLHQQNRTKKLEDALQVAIDDLYKAANQFAGLKNNMNNSDIFRNKAVRAEIALKK